MMVGSTGYARVSTSLTVDPPCRAMSDDDNDPLAATDRPVLWITTAPAPDPAGDEGPSDPFASVAPLASSPVIGGVKTHLSPTLRDVVRRLSTQVAVIATVQKRARVTYGDREQRALAAAFVRFDTDDSNSISKSELSKLMTHLGYQLSDDDLHNLINQVASEGESELTFEQTSQLMQMYKEAAQFKLLEFDPEPQSVRDDSGTTFERLLNRYLPLTPSDDPAVGLWECFMLLCGSFGWMASLYLLTLPWGSLVPNMNAFVAFYLIVFVGYAADLAVRRRLMGIVPHWTVRCGLVVDVISAIPLEIILYAAAPRQFAEGDSTDLLLALKITLALKLIKVLAAPRYFQVSGLQRVNRVYIFLYAYVFPAFAGVCALLCLTQLLTVVWYLISTDDEMTYVQALFFTTYTITGVGYGSHPVRSVSERIVAAGYCLVAQALIAYVVGSIVNVVAESDVKGDGTHQIVQTMRVCEIGGVGDAITRDAVNFQDHLVRNKLADAYGGLVSNLPTELRENITLFVKVRLVASDSVFMLAHRATQVALARVLEAAVCLPGEYLFLEGEVVHDMIFIGHGNVQP
jgi:hypothetical protein